MPFSRPRSRSCALAATISSVASTRASASASSAASLVARVAVASVREAVLARRAVASTASATVGAGAADACGVPVEVVAVWSRSESGISAVMRRAYVARDRACLRRPGTDALIRRAAPSEGAVARDLAARPAASSSDPTAARGYVVEHRRDAT